MKTHSGVWYFGTFETALDWAERNGWPTHRIIEYARGFAVQSGPSGNYAGPDDVLPRLWQGRV